MTYSTKQVEKRTYFARVTDKTENPPLRWVLYLKLKFPENPSDGIIFMGVEIFFFFLNTFLYQKIAPIIEF